MRLINKILFFTFLMLISSCEEYISDCDDCVEILPAQALLSIRVNNSSSSQSSYYVTVYRGKIEDNIIVDERETRWTYSIYVDINQEYSAVSTVILDNIEYTAVSSTTVKVIVTDDYCNKICYIITDNEIDLRLKYY
jgi:hypothetical protein